MPDAPQEESDMPSSSLYTRIKALLDRKVVRFAIVGGMGIPINVGFLFVLHREFRLTTLVAWLLAFECSSLVNFYANQRFTYHEQTHVQGIEWLWRAFRAQLSSISGVAINAMVFGVLLMAGMHYLEADAGGIIAAFSANFFISSRFVFLPAAASAQSTAPEGDRQGLGTVGRSAPSAEYGHGQGAETDYALRGLGSLVPAEDMA
jgi:putative flippase GtrA